MSGLLAEAAGELGVTTLHLSLAVEGDVAIAYVVAEGSVTLDGPSHAVWRLPDDPDGADGMRAITLAGVWSPRAPWLSPP